MYYDLILQSMPDITETIYANLEISCQSCEKINAVVLSGLQTWYKLIVLHI